MAKKRSLDSITIPAPCPKKWDEMRGTDQTRFCGSCEKDIYNISAMTRTEARKLLFESTEKVCIRMERDENGKIKTLKNQLHQITRRAPIAAGVLSATLMLSSVMMAQDKVDITHSGIVITQADKSPSSKMSLSGTVTDIYGAVIPETKIILRNTQNDSTLNSVSDTEGFYLFKDVEPSTYEISTQYPAYKKLVYKGLQITGDKNLQINFTLELESPSYVVGTYADEPIVELKTSGDLIRKIESLPTSKRHTKNQTRTSQVSFTIVDVTDAVIPGAKVLVVNRKRNKQFTISSNREGFALILDLPRGAYKAEISADGFEKRIISLLVKNEIEPDIRITLDVKNFPLMGDFTFIEEPSTPLLEAVQLNNLEEAVRLIKSKHNVNQIDKYENDSSLLHIAVDAEKVEMVKLLLKSKARINVKDGNGNTPLMLTVLDKNFEIIRLLLEAGANPNLKNKNGDRAIDLTYSKEVEKLLVKYKSQPPKPE